MAMYLELETERSQSRKIGPFSFIRIGNGEIEADDNRIGTIHYSTAEPWKPRFTMFGDASIYTVVQIVDHRDVVQGGRK